MIALVVMAMWAVTAGAPPAQAEWRRVNAGNFNAYQWFDDAGNPTSRFVSESTFDNQAKRMVAGTKRYGVGQTINSNYSNVATRLQTALQEAHTRNTNAARRLASRAWQAAQRMGTMPKITTATWALTAGVFGWKIGSTAAGKFLQLQAPEADDPPIGTDMRCRETATTLSPQQVTVGAGECYLANGVNVVTTRNLSSVHEPPYDGLCGDTNNPPAKIGAFTRRNGTPTTSCGHPITSAPLGTVWSVWIYDVNAPASGKPGDAAYPVAPPTPFAGETADETSVTPPNVPDATAEERAKAIMTDPAMDPYTQFVNFNDGIDDAEDGELGWDPLLPTIPHPGAHEHVDDYVQRLEDVDLVAAPEVLSDNGIDPGRGPLEVVRTAPQSGTQVDPGTEVVVRYNPETAPEVSAWSAPGVRAPDLTPLASIGSPCDVFPFGVFCWLHEALGGWGTNSACPSFTIPFASADLEMDLCTFNPAVDVFRPILALVSLICAVYMFGAAGMGFGGGSNDD